MANIPSIKNLALDDYVAVKEKAYDFFVKNSDCDIKYINEYVKNGLEYKGDEPEALIFTSTVLIPFDEDVCRLYQSGSEQYAQFRKNNPIYGKYIDMKLVEIENYGLDRLINEKVLIPPQQADYIAKKSGKQ